MSLNSVNQLILVMVKYGVLFEVRAEFLNTVHTSFGFNDEEMLCRLKWGASVRI
jgi:hypothetical protein